MKIRSIFQVVIFGVVFLLAGCQGGESGSSAAERVKRTIPVTVIRLENSDFAEYGEYYGKVSGIEEATLVSIAGGTVESIEIEEGDSVYKGQSLGKINAKKAQANYELADLNEKIARQKYDTQLQFLEKGNTSQQAVNQSHLDWLTSKNNLIDAEKIRDSSICVSPIDGVVISRFIDLHQEVAPGGPTFSVSNMNAVKVTIGIPESDMAGVATGAEAEISLATHPGRKWDGILNRLSNGVSSQTMAFRAEIRIEKPEGLLLTGTTAKVTLRRRTLSGQIIVPTESILTNGQETYVMLEDNNKVAKIPVETRPSNRTHTVILKGLRAGEKLIVEGNHLVQDGVEVIVTVAERAI